MADWASLRRSDNVEDRRDDPWPWASVAGKQTPTLLETAHYAIDKLLPPQIPAATRLGLDAGIHDIGPLSKEQVMKFLTDIEMLNPDPEPLQTHNEKLEPYNGRR